MMQPRVVKQNLTLEKLQIPEGCHILETWNTEIDDSVSIARARVAPGGSTEWHQLEGIVERYLVVEGRGLVEIGNLAPTEMGPGDLAFIPAGARQRITNTGPGDLIFYCICTPRFRQERYRAYE
jgi:mannose-6-phosphate isomerase-like protein (cupin superfamily)